MENQITERLFNENGYYTYVSHSGVKYEVAEATAEYNIITDYFPDYSKENPSIGPHYKIVDYVYGNIAEEPEEIREWIDQRIDFYENHERTIIFDTGVAHNFERVMAYIGNEEKMDYYTNGIKEINKEELYKYIEGDRELSGEDATKVLSDLWYGKRPENFDAIAYQMTKKMYELRTNIETKNLVREPLTGTEAYIRCFENDMCLYKSMDALIESEYDYEYAYLSEDERPTLSECAKNFYEQIGKSVFKLPCGWVLVIGY